MSTAQRYWLVSSVLAGPACTTKLGPYAIVQAKFGWDLREYLTFGLPLAPALAEKKSNTLDRPRSPRVVTANSACLTAELL